MKIYISIFTALLCFSNMESQEISVADAYRYAIDNTTGTARFRALSGAMGALGGDLSAINVNPAGSAVFANNQVAVTASNFNVKNNSTYFGKQTSDSNNSLEINQAGGVFVFENNNSNSDWKKFSLGLNYENTNNFDNKLYSAGLNPLNSGTRYFVNNANGTKLKLLEDGFYDELSFTQQQGFLGYQGYLITPLTSNLNNESYFPNVAATGNFYQENEVVSTGYNGKFNFNFATQYKDNLYLGINLNAHFFDLNKSTSFYEDYDDGINRNANIGIQEFRFNNNTYSYGNGFSLQLGAIAKIATNFRLGLAYESPTWMTINDELTQTVTGYCADCVDANGVAVNNINQNPNVTNIYEPYSIQTPSKYSGSLAYVFGKKGLISFDYGLKDYSNTSFGPASDPVFKNLNQVIVRDARKQTSEYRVGAEYRIEQVSLRGGYRFEQSPYKNSFTIGNLTSYSGGLGYNFGDTKLDLAYTFAKRDFQEQFLPQGMTDKALINSKNNTVTLTLAFEL
ncbi:OmpP1/FadL family transporter [Flavobacterium sp.]|uniref:OmpP1/FadL family transporter n=1 Tax=Flavobacterium sp. TaxID=239 RepID=UPI0037509664